MFQLWNCYIDFIYMLLEVTILEASWSRSGSNFNSFHFSLFFKQEMELSLIGLQNAGKTSLVNAIAVSCVNLFSLQ